MPTETTERKPAKPTQIGAPPPEPEHLPCPRCDSTNTKFCYYNNYNFSQPRHFCKSCRRYWTHGGTLRDIPVGGGSRKNAKRSRTNTAASCGGGGGSSAVFSPAHYDFRHMGSQVRVPFAADHSGFVGGSFTSLLNGSQGSSGLLALGGFGLGIEDVGFGLGRAVWPFPAVVEGGGAVGSGGGSSVGGNTWQLENGDGGFVGNGDCFALPDLAISTPGSVLK